MNILSSLALILIYLLGVDWLQARTQCNTNQTPSAELYLSETVILTGSAMESKLD